MPLDLEELERQFTRTLEHLRAAHPNVVDEWAREELENLLGYVRVVSGVGCPECRGVGQKAYSSTATWRRGGIAGQAITNDVCDVCWGTGLQNQKGVDLRRLMTLQREVEMLKVNSAPPAKEKRTIAVKVPIKKQKLLAFRGKQVSGQRDGREILGDVIDAYYDVKGQLRLKVQYFNGEPWPWDPSTLEIKEIG